MANWASVDRLGNPLSPGWQDQNLSWIEPVPGQRWQVYKPAAQAFEGLLKDLAAVGYPLQSSGGFNYRNMRGSDKLSQHAFGTAIDINAATNPMLKSRGQAVVTDLPPNIEEIAAKYGLEWGGKWQRPDAMHFEWAGGSQPTPTPTPTPNTQIAAADGPKGQESYPAPVMGSMIAQAPASQSSSPIPAGVQAAASPSSSSPLGDVFGMMMAAQAMQQPQAQPVQIMGPSPEQANALNNFLQTLRGRPV